jgi:hypothetical protein
MREDGLGDALALGTRERFESSSSSRRHLPAPEASRFRSKRTPAAMIGPARQGAPLLVDAGDQANAASAVVGKEGRVAH